MRTSPRRSPGQSPRRRAISNPCPWRSSRRSWMHAVPPRLHSAGRMRHEQAGRDVLNQDVQVGHCSVASGHVPAATLYGRLEGTPLGRLPGPTNVARYVRDRDQQRWRRSVGSSPLAPTIRVVVRPTRTANRAGTHEPAGRNRGRAGDHAHPRGGPPRQASPARARSPAPGRQRLSPRPGGCQPHRAPHAVSLCTGDR